MEGTARIDPDGPAASANPAYLAKYQGEDRGLRLDRRLVRRELPGHRAHHADPLAGRLTAVMTTPA